MCQVLPGGWGFSCEGDDPPTHTWRGICDSHTWSHLPHGCSLTRGCFSNPCLTMAFLFNTFRSPPITLQKSLDPVVSRIMSPKDGHVLMLGTCDHVVLHGGRDLAGWLRRGS